MSLQGSGEQIGLSDKVNCDVNYFLSPFKTRERIRIFFPEFEIFQVQLFKILGSPIEV